jgi:hypothetical protein
MQVMDLTWELVWAISIDTIVREDGRRNTALVLAVEEVGPQWEQRATPWLLVIMVAGIDWVLKPVVQGLISEVKARGCAGFEPFGVFLVVGCPKPRWEEL